MKLQNLICSLLLTGLALGCASTDKDRELQAQAKISKADAEKTALAKVPGGTVKEGGLEKENGKLIYSFDIATPGTKNITEVQVDAITGAVVDVAKETPAEQAKEKEADAKAKKGKKAEKEDDDEKQEKK